MTAARILALVGPTASGKSRIALDVADRRGDVEIVAVDAFTVYRGMDVATAKPSAADRRRVPHHLMDVLDPWQDCTAEWFQQVARDAIAQVLGRGRTPLLVGGSGLYFRAVVDDLAFPPTDAAVRAEIEAAYAEDPRGAHAALAAVDPRAAGRIEPDNLRRSVRALEVHRVTGRQFSEWRRAWDHFESVYRGLRVVGLDVPRPVLTERIHGRVDAMLAGGLLEECRRLAAGPLSTTARQAIGYAEMLDHLAGRCSLDEAIDRVRARTRRYAARQARWFAADPRVRWAVPSSAYEVLTG